MSTEFKLKPLFKHLKVSFFKKEKKRKKHLVEILHVARTCNSTRLLTTGFAQIPFRSGSAAVFEKYLRGHLYTEGQE